MKVSCIWVNIRELDEVPSIKLSTLYTVTNFIQLISPQLVDQFSQTKLHWKAPNDRHPHIYRIYKSDNRLLRYQTISNYKFH